MGYFGGYFACPTALLEDTRINAHEVYARQIDWLSLVRNCPINIKRTTSNTIVRMTVGIAVLKGLLYPICAFSIRIIGIIGQTRTNKSERGIRKPLREILLRMEGVFMEIPRLVVAVCPMDICSVGNRVFLIRLWRMVGWCTVVGEGLMV